MYKIKNFIGKEQYIFDTLIEFVIIFLVIFIPFTHGAVELWSTTGLQVIAALLFIFWCAGQIKGKKLELANLPFLPFIIVFIIYVSLQLFFSISPPDNTSYYLPSTIYAWVTRTELLKIIAYIIIFLCIINTIKTKRGIIRILSLIIGTGFIMSIFYLMRYFRIPAPMGIINPDHFSGYLGMIIPVLIGFLLVPWKEARKDSLYAKKSLLFYIIAVMGAALFFTMSRGGMLSFILALFFMAGLILKKRSSLAKGGIRTLIVIAGFIVLIIAWLGATRVIEELLSIKVEIASRYFGGRFPLWHATLNIIKDFPIFGTGLGTFNIIFPIYQPAQFAAVHVSHAHNDFLELLSELGIIGFLILCCGIVITVIYLIKSFFSRKNSWVIGMSIGLFGSLTSIFIHSFTDFNIHIPGNVFLMTILLALLINVLNLRMESKVPMNYKKIIFFIPSAKTANLKNVSILIIYILIFSLPLIYIITIIRPAMADYYFNKTSISRNRSSDTIISDSNLIKKAVFLNPGNAEYSYYLGKLQYDNYVRALKLDLQTVPLYLIYAINEYNKAIEINPWDRKYHQSLAWSYGQLARTATRQDNLIPLSYKENHRKAINEFETAIKLATNNPYAHRIYAIWLLQHSSREYINKALSEYKIAISLEPELILEAIVKYKKASGALYNFNDLIPVTDNKNIYSSIEEELIKAGYKREAEVVRKLLL